MATANLSLLVPRGLLVCFFALLPLVVLGVASRRQRRVALKIGLRPAPARRMVVTAALAAGACGALGVAAAQPVLTTTTHGSARTASQIVFVVDVSRSMLASPTPGGKTRLDRARSVVGRLRAAVPDVPAGISGLTDRLLPYVFPTLDMGVFSATLAQSVRIDSPPPQESSTVATSFAPLASLVGDGFFSPATERRTCVLVTDGETRSGSGSAAQLSGRRGCRLVVVRVGSAGDRIFRADGTVEASYRPERSASAAVEQLARLSGGSAFSEGGLRAASVALKSGAEVGPRRRVGLATTPHPLAPAFAGVAVIVCCLVVLRGFRRRPPGLQVIRTRRYDSATDDLMRRS